jgi:hypothetical protein
MNAGRPFRVVGMIAFEVVGHAVGVLPVLTGRGKHIGSDAHVLDEREFERARPRP